MEYNNFMLLTGETTVMIYQNILDAMGRTPMIRLNRMVPEGSARVLV